MQTKEKLETIKARNELDATVSQVDKFIKENESVDTSELKAELDKANEVIADENHTKDQLKNAQESLMKKYQEVGAKMYENQQTAQANPNDAKVEDDDIIDAEID